MEFSETVIIGGSCLATGLVLNGQGDYTVLERGAILGGEYFDTYRPISSMDVELKHEAPRILQEELRKRDALNDAYALAPLLYRALIPHTHRFKLWLEVIGIKRYGSEWEVEFVDAGGRRTIRCNTLIDATPNCRTVPEFFQKHASKQFLSAEVYTKTPEVFAQWAGSGLEFHPGREPDEIFISCTFPPGISLPEMRRVLLQRWTERPATLADSRIRSIAKAVGYVIPETVAKLSDNFFWINPNSFPDPLSALDHSELPLDGAKVAPCSIPVEKKATEDLPVLLYSELRDRQCVRHAQPVKFDFHTELLIAGLGSGGAIAATVAADHGISVVAVEKLPLAGGTGTAGGVMSYYHDYPGGAFEEIDRASNAIRSQDFDPSYVYNADAKAITIESHLLKNGCRILYESSVIGIWLDLKAQKALGIRVATPEGIRDIGCSILIDATGNGDLSAMIGAKFQEGCELDGRCQPFSSARVYASGNGVRFANFDAGYIQISDPENITAGIIASNSLHIFPPDQKPERILWLTQLPGAREGRLPIGDRTLSFQDGALRKKTDFKILAYAYSNFDDHSQDWAFADRETLDWMVVSSLWGKFLTIPLTLDIMLVKGFENFITAGRALSVDHLMASLLRMQRSIQKLGEIAALAATQSIKTGLPLRELDLDQLEAEVRHSGTLNEKLLIDTEYPSDPAIIRQLLDSDTPGEAIWITAHNIEQYGDILHELVANGSEHARRNASIALGLAGDDSVRPILRRIIEEADDFLPKMTKNPKQNQPRRLAAICLLGRFKNKSDADFLLAILTSLPSDAQVFSHTLRSLLELGDELVEIREMLRQRIEATFTDDRFSYRILMKSSSACGEMVYHELNNDLQLLAKKHFMKWSSEENT